MEENVNVWEKGSGTGATSSIATREMFNQYMRDMMRVIPAAVGAGVVMQQSRVDFAKIYRDFINLGGKIFAGSESVIEVQKWLDTYDRIFSDLELEDAMKRRVASRQLTGRAMWWWNTMVVTTSKNMITWR